MSDLKMGLALGQPGVVELARFAAAALSARGGHKLNMAEETATFLAEMLSHARHTDVGLSGADIVLICDGLVDYVVDSGRSVQQERLSGLLKHVAEMRIRFGDRD